MTRALKGQVQLGATASAIHTASTSEVIAAAVVCNTDGLTGYNFTAHIVASGGSAGATNMVYNAKAVAAGESLGLGLLTGMAIPNGGSLQMFADTADKLTVQISVDANT